MEGCQRSYCSETFYTCLFDRCHCWDKLCAWSLWCWINMIYNLLVCGAGSVERYSVLLICPLQQHVAGLLLWAWRVDVDQLRHRMQHVTTARHAVAENTDFLAWLLYCNNPHWMFIRQVFSVVGPAACNSVNRLPARSVTFLWQFLLQWKTVLF